MENNGMWKITDKIKETDSKGRLSRKRKLDEDRLRDAENRALVPPRKLRRLTDSSNQIVKCLSRSRLSGTFASRQQSPLNQMSSPSVPTEDSGAPSNAHTDISLPLSDCSMASVVSDVSSIEDMEVDGKENYDSMAGRNIQLSQVSSGYGSQGSLGSTFKSDAHHKENRVVRYPTNSVTLRAKKTLLTKRFGIVLIF